MKYEGGQEDNVQLITNHQQKTLQCMEQPEIFGE